MKWKFSRGGYSLGSLCSIRIGTQKRNINTIGSDNETKDPKPQTGGNEIKTKRHTRGGSRGDADIEVRCRASDKDKLNMRMMIACIREIQAPLSDLRGLKDVIPHIPVGSSMYHYAKSMSTCGLLLADMIENLRMYYLLESDMYDVNNSAFILRAELVGVWNKVLDDHGLFTEFSDEVSQFGNISCDLFIREDVPNGVVVSDSDCVLKVFGCMLSNAMRFTLEGSIHVDVYTSDSDEEYGKNLHFVVKDTGVGIPPDVAETIFEPLTKGHAESIQGGVGMGLPVSRSICKILGGSLLLEQDGSGVGSIFHAQFPIHVTKDYGHIPTPERINTILYPDSGKSDDNRRRESLENTSSVSISDSPSVLLVEDIKLNRTIVSKMLADVGVAVHLAVDGLEAVEMCKTTSFDIILMDLIMPKMGGIDATREIRSTSNINSETPVVALTGIISGNAKKECLRIGMVDFLTKPVMRKDLIDTIVEYIDHDLKSWSPPQIIS